MGRVEILTGVERRRIWTDEDKKPPAGAKELEAMLRADLPSTLEDKVSVVVLDISRPDTMVKSKQPGTRKLKPQHRHVVDSGLQPSITIDPLTDAAA
ncbi:hypothetical protein [Sinorhizobium mexicanum]|uniref:Uncharacterized protein n=1 Tax=Sinorhizobium mexicanum TaxID=375549 RepID=A0A859QZK1_9HYPH|nr:hypothetical protein [Sinorhizobium mexicanum]MBP1884990.1 hypothetical protein [Sinorhizobium mexicanum]QLL64271.1 hypothetical protein FKV68_22755 [Sinorhizobium mexicanum]